MKIRLSALALVAAIFCGGAYAQNPFAGETPVKIELKTSFTSKDKVGTEITAKTDSDIMLGTTKLPSGSTLVGHIVDVAKHSKESPDGTVSILFDHVKPKKGDPIAIKTSLFKLLPPYDFGQQSNSAEGMRGTTDEQYKVAANRSIIDANSNFDRKVILPTDAPVAVVSYIRSIAFSPETGETKSAVLMSKDADVEMTAGMNLIVGIAPASK